jgi:hypothetical protein
MPSTVYSTVLWEENLIDPSGAQALSSPVPEGFTWVVMTVTAASNSLPAATTARQLLFFADGFLAWATPFNASRRGHVYVGTELRLVVAAGSLLGASSLDAAGYHLRVTGFQLTGSLA